MEKRKISFLERMYLEFMEHVNKKDVDYPEPTQYPNAHEERIGILSLEARILLKMKADATNLYNAKCIELQSFIDKIRGTIDPTDKENKLIKIGLEMAAQKELLEAREKALEELVWAQVQEDCPSANSIEYPHVGFRKGFLVVRFKDFNQIKN